MRTLKVLACAAIAGAVVLGPGLPAFAETATLQTTDVVTRDGYAASPSASDGLWYREDTRPGGSVIHTKAFGAPTGLGDGSLVLSTNSQNSAKAQLLTSYAVRGTALTDVTGLSYWTYQSTALGGSAEASASLQLRVDIDGDLNTTSDVTNLVYEPYWNDTEGPAPQQPLAPGTWQYWDATGGQWWTSKQITCDAFSVAPGAGGPPFTSPSQVATNCAGAKVLQIGVNVGSFNPNYLVGVDGLHFQSSAHDLTWNFGPK
jgi:hypothetical protein